MMFFAGTVRGTCRLSLFCDCGAFVLLAACPAATAADVTASPERKSLRFMGPHFRGKGNAEGYQMQRRATSLSPRLPQNGKNLMSRGPTILPVNTRRERYQEDGPGQWSFRERNKIPADYGIALCTARHPYDCH